MTMEEKLNKVSKEEMKKQEKYFQNKMKDLKNEENTVREMLNQKKEKESGTDWHISPQSD